MNRAWGYSQDKKQSVPAGHRDALFLVREGYLYVSDLFLPTIELNSRQSSEKYFANRRKTVVKFIIIAYNRGNTEEGEVS